MPSSGVQTCALDRKSTRLNSSHGSISYAVFCLKKINHHHLASRDRRLGRGTTRIAPRTPGQDAGARATDRAAATGAVDQVRRGVLARERSARGGRELVRGELTLARTAE